MQQASPLEGNTIYANKDITIFDGVGIKAGTQLTIKSIESSHTFLDGKGSLMPVVIQVNELPGVALSIDALEHFCDEMNDNDVKWYFDPQHPLNNRIKKYE